MTEYEKPRVLPVLAPYERELLAWKKERWDVNLIGICLGAGLAIGLLTGAVVGASLQRWVIQQSALINK